MSEETDGRNIVDARHAITKLEQYQEKVVTFALAFTDATDYTIVALTTTGKLFSFRSTNQVWNQIPMP